MRADAAFILGGAKTILRSPGDARREPVTITVLQTTAIEFEA